MWAKVCYSRQVLLMDKVGVNRARYAGRLPCFFLVEFIGLGAPGRRVELLGRERY